MSAESVTLRGQAAAERIMVDAGRVRRPNGTALDPTTLEELPSWQTIWTGPCRVQRSGALSPNSNSPGGYEFGVKSLLAQLPVSATGIQRGDVFEVTAIGPVTDADVLGLVATVEAVQSKTHATKRTLICEEVA